MILACLATIPSSHEWRWYHAVDADNPCMGVFVIVFCIVFVLYLIALVCGGNSSGSSSNEPRSMRNKKARYDKKGEIIGYEDKD